MPFTFLFTLYFLYQQVGDDLPFTRADQRYTQLVRGVDRHALKVWQFSSFDLFDPVLYGSMPDVRAGKQKWIPHDGLTWKEREDKYHFNIIGLVPDEFFDSSVSYVMAPKEIELLEESRIFRRSMGEIIEGPVVPAEAFHFYISMHAKRMSDKELFGPLACRTIVVLMRNRMGSIWYGAGERVIALDSTVNPKNTFIFHRYIDPEAAQKFIEENMKDEEGTNRFIQEHNRIVFERLSREAEEINQRQQLERAQGGGR